MIIADVEAPGGERAKVLDFGIAKLDSGTNASVKTRTNTMMGTPVYMAPEQCRGLKTISDRADVYSLSVMMFEMLTGRPPFHAEAPGDLIVMHIFQPPPSLRDFLPDVDPVLQRLIEAMLSKDPQARPPMSEVAQQLKALGHLQSDVMPMRVLRESQGEPRPGTPGFGMPQRLRALIAPVPEPVAAVAPPEAAARPARLNDPDATRQIRDTPGPPTPPPPRSKTADKPVYKPRESAGWQAHVVAPQPKTVENPMEVDESEITTALPPDGRRSTGARKLTKAQQKRLELLVLLALVAVALLVGILVLLVGSSGEGSR